MGVSLPASQIGLGFEAGLLVTCGEVAIIGLKIAGSSLVFLLCCAHFVQPVPWHEMVRSVGMLAATGPFNFKVQPAFVSRAHMPKHHPRNENEFCFYNSAD
jgi:hypothetical protein